MANWTNHEIDLLKSLHGSRTPGKEIATMFPRHSLSSVYVKMTSLGIRPGARPVITLAERAS